MLKSVKNKFGDLIFGNLFGKFLNKTFPFILSYNFMQLKCFIFSNFNELVDKFMFYFPKFNINYDIFYPKQS